MFRPTLPALAASLLLTACETPTTQRYSISASNNQSIKQLETSGIGIANFASPPSFDPSCRAVGALHVADGLTHTQYIQRAFEDELKTAGAFTASKPRVTLSGKLNKLEFSSTRNVTGGSWTIDLSLRSSNGRSMKTVEYYEFNSGFAAYEACRNTAEAFSRAVQNLVGKVVSDPQFAELIK